MGKETFLTTILRQLFTHLKEKEIGYLAPLYINFNYRWTENCKRQTHKTFRRQFKSMFCSILAGKKLLGQYIIANHKRKNQKGKKKTILQLRTSVHLKTPQRKRQTTN